MGRHEAAGDGGADSIRVGVRADGLLRVLAAPNLITGVVTSGLGLAVLFGLPLTDAQTGGILTFLGAVVALITCVVTPTSEVVASQRPGEPVKAGVKAENAWGIVRGHVVEVNPVPTVLPPA